MGEGDGKWGLSGGRINQLFDRELANITFIQSR